MTGVVTKETFGTIMERVRREILPEVNLLASMIKKRGERLGGENDEVINSDIALLTERLARTKVYALRAAFDIASIIESDKGVLMRAFINSDRKEGKQ